MIRRSSREALDVLQEDLLVLEVGSETSSSNRDSRTVSLSTASSPGMLHLLPLNKPEPNIGLGIWLCLRALSEKWFTG